jgi:hypothetical protein
MRPGQLTAFTGYRPNGVQLFGDAGLTDAGSASDNRGRAQRRRIVKDKAHAALSVTAPTMGAFTSEAENIRTSHKIRARISIGRNTVRR